MNGHSAVEAISAYLDGQTRPEERGQVEAHLETCAACRAQLAELRRAKALVQRLDPVSAPAGLRTGVRERLQVDATRASRPRIGMPRLSLRGQPTWRVVLGAAAVLLIGLFSLNLLQMSLPVGNLERENSLFRGARSPQDVNRQGDERGDMARVAAPAAAPSAQIVAPSGQVVPGPRFPFERQVIRTADMHVQVTSFEDATKALVRIAESAGGFVADSSIAQTDPPAGTFVLRVPSLRFAPVLDQIEDLGKVTARRVSGQDVTEEFIDLRARIRNLEQHERQLLTFMGRATRVADLLAIEQELARVRGEIEQLTGRLRFIGNRVEMATVQVALREKAKQGSVIFWDFSASLLRIRGAFLGTIRQVLAGAEVMVVTLSAIVPVVLLGLVGWGIIRWFVRRGAAA